MNLLQNHRNLTLNIVHNARHLGDLPLPGGRRTAGAGIVRSGNLSRLTDEGIDALRDAGIRTVVDFRSTEELNEYPAPDLTRHGVTIVHVPVFEHDASPAGLEGDFPGFATVYREFLECGAPAYRTLAETLADEPDGVLFHCAVGKDRTGVASALLLELAGVTEEVILEDYSRSAEELQPLFEEFRAQWKEREIDEARARAMMAAPAEDMASTLAYVRERWGSAEGYFAEIGVAAGAISALRARLAG